MYPRAQSIVIKEKDARAKFGPGGKGVGNYLMNRQKNELLERKPPKRGYVFVPRFLKKTPRILFISLFPVFVYFVVRIPSSSSIRS